MYNIPVYDIVTIFGILLNGIVLAILCHYYIREYIYACLASSILSSISWQIVVYIKNGFLNPLYLLALATSLFFYFILSLIVGIPFFVIRKNKMEKGDGGKRKKGTLPFL